MTFDFEVNEVTGQSAVIANADGARGIQILAVIAGLGDDNNRAAVQIVAVSDEASQGGTRVEGLIPNDASLLLFYPGVVEETTTTYFARAAVLPAKFQVQVSNRDGREMSGVFHCSLLP